MKWVDNHRGVFNVEVVTVSAIHTQVRMLLCSSCCSVWGERGDKHQLMLLCNSLFYWEQQVTNGAFILDSCYFLAPVH